MIEYPLLSMHLTVTTTLGSKNTEFMNKLKWVLKETMMFIMFTVAIFVFLFLFFNPDTKNLYHCAPVLGKHIYRLYTSLKCVLKIMLRNLTHALY